MRLHRAAPVWLKNMTGMFQLLHLARGNSPQKNHNHITKHSSLLNSFLAVRHHFSNSSIHAFCQTRDNILNASSCIHKRSLLLNIWRYENRRERERHYLCLETDINGKLQTKFQLRQSLSSLRRSPCVGRSWQRIQASKLFRFYMKWFNTKDNLPIWNW